MITFRRALERSVRFKAVHHTLRTGIMRALCRASPELLGRLRYRAAWGRWPDLEKPITFDEKLLWLNFYWCHPLKAECGDKFALRGYVERHGMAHLLPRLYGVYNTVEAIDFEALPSRFVLKCTHGCRCNVFCQDKTELDLKGTRRDLTRWLTTDYSTLLGELHYARMKPRILCEEFLDDGTGEFPTDYKLYCFGGHVHCTLVCTGREANGKATFGYMDRKGNFLPYDSKSVATRRCITRPAPYEEMISVAEKLSAPFPFVRTDFYCIRERVVLGEMTFTPSACVDRTHTELASIELGDLITLPVMLPPPERRSWRVLPQQPPRGEH